MNSDLAPIMGDAIQRDRAGRMSGALKAYSGHRHHAAISAQLDDATSARLHRADARVALHEYPELLAVLEGESWSPASHWIDREGRTTLDGAEEPGLEMSFHDEWSHSVFATASGYQVVLGPIGIDLGTFAAQAEACAVAEANARTRALNTLQSARRDIARAMAVLGALDGCAFSTCPEPARTREEMIAAGQAAIHGGRGCTCRAGAVGDAMDVLIAAGVIQAEST